MDLSVSFASSYPTSRDYTRAVEVRASGTETIDPTSAEGRREASRRALANPASVEAQRQREETARKQDPTAEATRSPGFVFEYEDSQRVMKVHNQKGALIYQVPSKGQLTLIQAEEKQQVQLTA
jgi:hypothetical protein